MIRVASNCSLNTLAFGCPAGGAPLWGTGGGRGLANALVGMMAVVPWILTGCDGLRTGAGGGTIGGCGLLGPGSAWPGWESCDEAFCEVEGAWPDGSGTEINGFGRV